MKPIMQMNTLANLQPKNKQFALYSNDEGLQCVELLNGKWMVVRRTVGGSFSRIVFSDKPSGFDDYELVEFDDIDGLFNSDYYGIYHVFEGAINIRHAVGRLKEHIDELEMMQQDGWHLAHEGTDVLHLEIDFKPFTTQQMKGGENNG